MNDPNADNFEITPFFDVTPDWVCIASREGFWKKINKAIPLALEYSVEELKSTPIASFIHSDDMELTRLGREKLLAGKPLINFENRYVSKSGKVIWLHWTSIYVPDREVVFAIAKDVTEKKKIEKEIENNYQKFKGLASHFKTVLEKDRELLAMELHEELAQIAAVVKMDIDSLATHLHQLPGGIQARLDHALAASDLLIRTIRRITFSISPDLSANFG